MAPRTNRRLDECDLEEFWYRDIASSVHCQAGSVRDAVRLGVRARISQHSSLEYRETLQRCDLERLILIHVVPSQAHLQPPIAGVLSGQLLVL